MVEELYYAFGQRLRRARRRAHLTQEQLGRRVGLSRTSITNMEKGAQHVSLHHLFDFAQALGVPPHELLPEEPVSADAARLPSRIKGALRRLDEDDQAWVLQVVSKGTTERERGDATK
jgi:transcriptional regulator with XRE-family HTH domain